MIPTLMDLNAILPILIVLGWALVLLLVDLWLPEKIKGIFPALAVLGLAAGIVAALLQHPIGSTAFNGMIVVDGFAIYLAVLFFASGIGGILLAQDYLKRLQINRSEYYPLLLFSVCGMALIAYSNDLIMIFLSLELLSIPLYILSGFARPQVSSLEAALKYFLLGTFAATFVLLGIALIFGGTGQTNLNLILAAINAKKFNFLLILIGSGLIVTGFGFKMAAVPFHMWAPDVYQGAPTSVTGFMSVGAKAAGVAVILRVLITVFQGLALNLTPVLWGIAALTMVVGNIAALAQYNIKRLLAYSSIAHGGYLLMALVPYGQAGLDQEITTSILFYLIVYALSSFGAWAVVILLEQSQGKGLELKDYSGLGRKNPLLAVAMMVFMLSFTGMPLTLGFWGKFYLFRTTVAGGFANLALIGLLASVVSAYYYIKVIVIMYMQPGDPELRTDEPWMYVIAGSTAAAVVLFSFIPAPLLQLASNALLVIK
jgi:NADH-quinone oxidoreductase subunit N